MSMTKQKHITKEEIIDYLTSNPSFIENNPKLWEYISFSNVDTKKGNIADLQQHVISNLQEKIVLLQDLNSHLLETATHNFYNQTDINECMLMLMETECWHEAMEVITTEWVDILDICAIKILAVPPISHSKNPVDNCNKSKIISLGDFKNKDTETPHELVIINNDQFKFLMNGNDFVIRNGKNLTLKKSLYGDSCICSDLIIEFNHPFAEYLNMAIAFSHNEEQYFNTDQGYEHISFLLQGLEIMFKHWSKNL